MSTTISPKVNRRSSAKKRQRAFSSLPAHQSAESHHNALRAIRSFLKSCSSYDVFPVSYRLIVLDNKLEVKKALTALISNGVVSAPLWDAEKSCFAGMFTVADIIHLIQYYYDTSSYNDAAADVEHFQLESLREIERALNVPPPPLLSIHPLRPLYDACQYLQQTHARRLPLLDRDQQTGDEVVLSVLTQYRVLKFISINCREIPHLHLGLKFLGIGTYVSPTASIEHPENPFWPIKTATLNTTVFDVVHMFSKDGIGAVPIIDENGVVVNLYETVDVVTLVRLGAYQSLDLTISSALSQRSPDFPGVITCTGSDSLASLLLLIKQRRVHRLVVVEGDDRTSRTATPGRDRSESGERSPPPLSASAPSTSTTPTHTGNPITQKPLKGRLVGIITLSDILRYLVGNTEQSILGGGINSENWDDEFDGTGESPTTVRGYGARRSGGLAPEGFGYSASASGSTGPSAFGTPADGGTPAVDDYPMTEEVDRDAEMDDYDGYYDDAAMVDESGAGDTQLKEYDMEGDVEYGEPMMVAEATDGMVTEQPQPASTIADAVPIVTETAVPTPAVPILPEVVPTTAPQPLPTPPQVTPITTFNEIPSAAISTDHAEVPLPVAAAAPVVVEATTNPVATSIAQEIKPPTPPQENTGTLVPIEPTTQPEPQVPQAENSLPEKDLVPASASITSEAPQDAPTVTTEESTGVEESAQPIEAAQETIQSLVAHLPTVVVPHITLYFDEQAFILFAPQTELEDSPPALLTGRPELYVAPIDQLLRALRMQETQHLSPGEDLVLGLEYPDLDLCIDENSKYASSYTLQNICDAMVACNHPNIVLTLYQVADFEYSLKQRLAGIIPEFPHEEISRLDQSTMADSHPPAEPTIQIPETLDPPIEKDEGPRPNVVAVPQTETVEENPHSEISQVAPTEPEHQDGQTEHLQAPLSMDLPEQSEVTVIEVSAAVLATELPTEVEENDGTEPVEAEYEPDELDDEEDLGEPVPPEDTQTSSNDLSNPAPHGLGDESAESSATLESSVHEEAEVEYDGEGDLADGEGDFEEAEELHPEPGHNHAGPNDLKPEEPSPQLIDPLESQVHHQGKDETEEVSEHDELDDHEPQNILSDKPDGVQQPEDKQSPTYQSQGASSNASEYEVYEEYEEYEEVDDAADQGLPQLEEIPLHEPVPNAVIASDDDAAKTPPVLQVTRITPPGKRTLQERDAEDEYDFDVDDVYETGAKRARVE